MHAAGTLIYILHNSSTRQVCTGNSAILQERKVWKPEAHKNNLPRVRASKWKEEPRLEASMSGFGSLAPSFHCTASQKKDDRGKSMSSFLFYLVNSSAVTVLEMF